MSENSSGRHRMTVTEMKEISWRLAGAPGEASVTLRAYVYDGMLRGELWQKRPAEDYSRRVWWIPAQGGIIAPRNPVPELGTLLARLAERHEREGWTHLKW